MHLSKENGDPRRGTADASGKFATRASIGMRVATSRPYVQYDQTLIDFGAHLLA
ncbi:uncharacterized protein LACBIDRAFT_309892 [Laccaria bicolor S238N-H82]|uniref:Predicted protein n=1 Tax=Laccaria bicolor (strain S238N-H82 / ATCC MYA-4686) TaxID=486041 RepID=B0DTA7_LACBS|nr:uncharacterized protein LACBIDRAFT_309892 [Laccaria bicolor S238N-H82]EDR02243.1 predicted protein [Laccaria bicolor S238N-H82]|eukprot:XP_001887188.1 predicted protein [Laccaria bicolor S238N-H82]